MSQQKTKVAAVLDEVGILLPERLAIALQPGYYGTVRVEINVQDGIAQSIRTGEEQQHRISRTVSPVR